MTTTEWLDPLVLPLWGSRLIEASAGTGKTWTIAALYVRLVLGMGETIPGASAGLLPPQILVVTFTRAATRELRERIRTRLVEAASVFEAPQEVATEDPFLQGLQRQYATPAQRGWAAWRLDCAAQAMDQAAILTIDAWCQRMLREHAFAAGSWREFDLLADETPYWAQALRDVWRQEVYPLEGDTLQALMQLWPHFAAFEQSVCLHLKQPGVLQEASLAQQQGQALEQRRQRLAPLKRDCASTLLPLQHWLLGLLDASSNPFHGAKLKADQVRGWFAALQRWCQEDSLQTPDVPEKMWHRLSVEGLKEALKKNQELEIPPAVEGFAALQQNITGVLQEQWSLPAQAAAKVHWRARQLKELDGVLGFQDLLEQFHALLHADSAQTLCARIRAQFPVAMIDEFQDTSTLQFQIFDRLYALDKNDPETAILLIGDPKQSIYAFRGADLSSYIRAKACTGGRHHALAVNYRSARALVAACNALFAATEEHSQAGAFLYRRGSDDPLPFVPVRPLGLPQQLKRGPEAVPALQLVMGSALRSAADDRACFAALAAQHLVQQLNAPECGFYDQAQGFERLRPTHVAILVRDRFEAEAMRQALSRRAVHSVYLSQQEGVFASVEARHLLYWLQAVSQPQDGRLLRAAFATATMDSDLEEMLQRATDDRTLEEQSALLQQLLLLWQRQGVLPMLRHTLFRLNLPARWLGRPGGERRLTNVLHLAELLQQASVAFNGEAALLRWFEDQVLGRGAQQDEQPLRLETDSDLVTILTIHKSKGLQFPVVYLPFAAHFRRGAEHSGDSSQAQTDLAHLQEEMRLLYVALTRAQHALWLGVGTYRMGRQTECALQRSALGYLLSAGKDLSWEHLLQEVQQRLSAHPEVSCGAAPPELPVPNTLLTRTPVPSLRPATVYSGRFSRHWRVSSFSALVRNLNAGPLVLQPADQALEEDWEIQIEEEVVRVGAEHSFPVGALAGKFLHEQLAWMAEQGFHRWQDPQTREALLLRCQRSLWAAQANGLLEWLQRLLRAPLPGGGCLQQLQDYRAEMEFWFPLRSLPSTTIDQLCAFRYLPTMPCRPLSPQLLQGFMMGFADLVFQWDGRWWVLDYKSNRLGAKDQDYTLEALTHSVAAHRYDVQGMIYLLALHRLLRARMGPDYAPSRHLGGALLMYLRGMQGPAAGCFVMPTDLALLEQLDGLMGQAGETWNE